MSESEAPPTPASPEDVARGTGCASQWVCAAASSLRAEEEEPLGAAAMNRVSSVPAPRNVLRAERQFFGQIGFGGERDRKEGRSSAWPEHLEDGAALSQMGGPQAGARRGQDSV